MSCRILERRSSTPHDARVSHTAHTYISHHLSTSTYIRSTMRCHDLCCYDAIPLPACLSAMNHRHCVSAAAHGSHTADRHPRVGRRPLRGGWDDFRALRDLAQSRVREGRGDRTAVRGRGGNFGRLLDISSESREGGKRVENTKLQYIPTWYSVAGASCLVSASLRHTRYHIKIGTRVAVGNRAQWVQCEQRSPHYCHVRSYGTSIPFINYLTVSNVK